MSELKVAPCALCSECMYSSYDEYDGVELFCDRNSVPVTGTECAGYLSLDIIQRQVQEMLSSIYAAMGGSSQTPLIVIAYAIVGHVNNSYTWDEQFIPVYCELSAQYFWVDIENIDLGAETILLQELVEKLLQECKDKAGIEF